MDLKVLFSAAAALLLSACGDAGPAGEKVSWADYSGKWPLTVESVELLCSPPAYALAKTEDGKVYVLSSSARSKAKIEGWLNGQEIIKPHPKNPQIRMDISDLVVRAQGLCSKS